MSSHHDTAWAVACRLVEIIAPFLREEEQADARKEFYDALVKELQVYDALANRKPDRPSKN